jgi:photosystem II stability/assembly factor-like uncharacterized protein
VATGAAGTILYSSDGAAWTPITKGTNALYGVAYGYSVTNAVANGNVFVAVGAAGTLLYSSVDGTTWYDTVVCKDSSSTVLPSCPAYDLKSVTYGGLDANGYGVFVAVGANGTVLTSEDGITWTLQASTTIPATSNLNSVTYSALRRFVAVADDGNIYYSNYYDATGSLVGNGAVKWNPATTTSTLPPIYAIATGGLYDYVAVGMSGLNVYADRSDY